MRRVRIPGAGIIGLLAALAACASPRTDPVDHTARVTTPAMIEVTELARDLSLSYSEGRSGMIHLERKPDNVIFVHESRSAHVNGERIEMVRPCMKHGTSYILSAPDADLVTRTLQRYRAERETREPEEYELPEPARASFTAMPAEWRPYAAPRRWRAIVIHHMASGVGSAAAIHRMHRQNGWDGLGYHFVIGNGSLSPDGAVEVGYRWRKQGTGAHCRAARAGDDNWWNRNSIGICLIGDFTSTQPSARQMEQLVRLVRILMDEYDIPISEIRPHGDVKVTACPGRDFPWDDFVRRIR